MHASVVEALGLVSESANSCSFRIGIGTKRKELECKSERAAQD
jgi:hypothetical protein